MLQVLILISQSFNLVQKSTPLYSSIANEGVLSDCSGPTSAYPLVPSLRQMIFTSKNKQMPSKYLFLEKHLEYTNKLRESTSYVFPKLLERQQMKYNVDKS